MRTHGAGARSVGGGVSRSFKLPGDPYPIFIKLDGLEALSAFEAEAEGLVALGATGGVAVPSVLDVGAVEDTAYLALEWLELGARTPTAQRRFGKGLAIQHRATAETFGWHRHNMIGGTPQRNTPTGDWLDFYRSERLGFQLETARQNGLPDQRLAQGWRVAERLESFFKGHRPAPSLLHGDLWSGNWGADADGAPYLFDPAVYHGDREADLAMTRLFGGFGADFYAAYQRQWPLAHGWERRVELYNLYHLLNHFNLFGASYLGRVAGSLSRLEAHPDT